MDPEVNKDTLINKSPSPSPSETGLAEDRRSSKRTREGATNREKINVQMIKDCNTLTKILERYHIDTKIEIYVL